MQRPVKNAGETRRELHRCDTMLENCEQCAGQCQAQRAPAKCLGMRPDVRMQGEQEQYDAGRFEDDNDTDGTRRNGRKIRPAQEFQGCVSRQSVTEK